MRKPCRVACRLGHALPKQDCHELFSPNRPGYDPAWFAAAEGPDDAKELASVSEEIVS